MIDRCALDCSRKRCDRQCDERQDPDCERGLRPSVARTSWTRTIQNAPHLLLLSRHVTPSAILSLSGRPGTGNRAGTPARRIASAFGSFGRRRSRPDARQDRAHATSRLQLRPRAEVGRRRAMLSARDDLGQPRASGGMATHLESDGASGESGAVKRPKIRRGEPGLRCSSLRLPEGWLRDRLMGTTVRLRQRSGSAAMRVDLTDPARTDDLVDFLRPLRLQRHRRRCWRARGRAASTTDRSHAPAA